LIAGKADPHSTAHITTQLTNFAVTGVDSCDERSDSTVDT